MNTYEERVKKGFMVALELGRVQDFTALAVAEKELVYKKPKYPNQYDIHFQIRHLERFQAGTGYPKIVERVASLMLTAPLYGNASWVIDATGVALPVVEDFAKLVSRKGVEAGAKKVLITSGDTESSDGAAYRVPRRDLASILQVLLSYDRLKIAPALKDAGLLSNELANFQVRVQPRDQPTDDLIWREATTDDLVLAVALACWLGNKGGGGARPAFCFGAI